MICNTCKVAGDLNKQNEVTKAKKFHKLCLGWCSCQHKTGPGWYVKAGQRPTLMQTQSP